MTIKYILGIDVGTSVIKSTLFNLEGYEIAGVAKETPLQHPQPSWAELDMDLVWQAVSETVRQIISELEVSPNHIKALGLTGQGDGTWLVDKNHQPVRPAITWLDGRVGEDVQQFQQDGLDREVFKITGTVITTSNQGLHLRWLQENEPDSLKNAVAALRAKDWIFLKMTGVVSTDETDASHTFFNIKNRAYDDSLFKLLGLEGWRHLIPEARPSYQNVSELQPAVAAEFGLSPKTPVVSGPFDVAATDVGVGAIMPGDACSILGTAGIHQLIIGEAATAPENIGYTMCHASPNRWVRLLPTMTGTLNLQWFVDQFFKLETESNKETTQDFWTYLESAVQQVPLGCDGVMYHPFIDPAGERAPFVKPSARAQFTGLNVHHGRETMLRAVYEGLVLSTLDCYAYLPAKVAKLKLAGGGSRSNLWPQMMSDALGCSVYVVEGKEFGAKGAALNAGVALGLYASFEEAVEKTIRPAREYHPDAQKTELYAELLKRYRQTYEVMFPVWEQSRKFEQSTSQARKVS